MCARRSSDSRRHPKQHPPSATAKATPTVEPTPERPAEAPLALPEETPGPTVDLGAIDVIDQRARRRAAEGRADASDTRTGPAPRSSGQRRVAPTVVHLGDRVSGPVSGVVERPLSTRGPGLEPPPAGPSVIVAPHLTTPPAAAPQTSTQTSTQTAPHLVTTLAAPQLSADDPPLLTPAAPPRAAPSPAASPKQSAAAPVRPSDAMTGPSNRPVKNRRPGTRPGMLLLAAAALFAVGFAFLRGPSRTSPSTSALMVTDRAELEAASALPPRTAPTSSESAGKTAPTNPTAEAQTHETPPAPTRPGAGTSAAPAAPPRAAEADRVELESPKPPAAAFEEAASSPPEAKRPQEEAASTGAPVAPVAPARPLAEASAPVARPIAPTTERPLAVATPTAPAKRATTANTVPATTDPGSRYDHVLPRAANIQTERVDEERRYDQVLPEAAKAQAERVAQERRYDHVLPRAAAAVAAPTPASGLAAVPSRATGGDDLDPRALARRYDHVPPRAAQLAAEVPAQPVAQPVTAKAEHKDTTPLSGSPRIYLQSDPPGASVAILGEVRGKTPIALDLDGRVEVILTHPERRPASVMLEPSRGARWLSITLDPR